MIGEAARLRGVTRGNLETDPAVAAASVDGFRAGAGLPRGGRKPRTIDRRAREINNRKSVSWMVETSSCRYGGIPL